MTKNNPDLPMYARITEDGRTEVVNCLYDNVPICGGQGKYVEKFFPSRYIGACIEAGAVLCMGGACAIYPCERVRDFMEGRI